MNNVPTKSPDEIHERNPKAIHGNFPPKEEAVDWSTGLCDCRSDFHSWCLTYWFPCITFGRTSEIIDEGSSSCTENAALYAAMAYFTGCACFYSFLYRTKMRNQYHLKGSPCGDLTRHCFCLSCALSQEYRELQNRGFDLSIGWEGNLERGSQPQEVSMAPVVERGMQR